MKIIKPTHLKRTMLYILDDITKIQVIAMSLRRKGKNKM